MINCNAENAGKKQQTIHAVLSKRLTFHLQLSKLEMIGHLASVEGKCYEVVNVKYLFYYYCYQFTQGTCQQVRGCIAAQFQYKKFWLTDYLRKCSFFHMI